ncbi:MAG: SDR family NAD(P)-dependent oxidoreductase, partial [Pseudomonadota bacterium]
MTAPNAGGALVTGAGKRIGRALALTLAEAGFDVAVHYNSSSKDAEAVADLIRQKGRKATVIQANLSDETQTETIIARATDALGALTLLVNSASTFDHDDIDTMTR